MASTKVCEACHATYMDTRQAKCSYCHKPLKVVSTAGMCPQVSLNILKSDMEGHTNSYYGTH